MNCLVIGPNGSGKSSLFRILGGLWPLFNGTLTRPKGKEIFYVPQKPYLPIGSLMDQIIYPDLYVDKSKESRLWQALSKVQLEYIVSREGGLETTRDW